MVFAVSVFHSWIRERRALPQRTRPPLHRSMCPNLYSLMCAAASGDAIIALSNFTIDDRFARRKRTLNGTHYVHHFMKFQSCSSSLDPVTLRSKTALVMINIWSFRLFLERIHFFRSLFLTRAGAPLCSAPPRQSRSKGCRKCRRRKHGHGKAPWEINIVLL